MTDQEIADNLSAVAALLDVSKEIKEMSEQIQNVSFEDLSRSDWLTIQEHQESVLSIANYLIESIPHASKVIADPAAMSHLSAVATAE